MKKVEDMLFSNKDEVYAAFQAKLTPTVPSALFIGVRVPVMRKLAREFARDLDHLHFLCELPHTYYDENMLHGLLLSEMKDYDACIEKLDLFLPYIDNWAVCDILSPKCFLKNREKLIEKIRKWSASEQVYTCRFGIGMLMRHYLDDAFKKEYLLIPAAIRSDEYYVNMMIAWYYATALAKQWQDTIVYLEEKRLPVWVHNKTIQKAVESYRICDEQKQYLRSLRRK